MSVSRQRLDRQIEALDELSRDELFELWQKNYKCEPPKGVKQPLLIRSAAYFLQVRKLGSLKITTHKALLSIAAGYNHKPKPAKAELRSGVRLLREWHGVTHQVIVLNTGFEWHGEVYSSLSAVAKAITGAKWSGPRFFGL